MTDDAPLAIGDLAERTGIAVATLRMWESRYGFPAPERLASGHRRYSEADLEAVRQVARDRAAGMSLPAAIARAQQAQHRSEGSIFAGLRRRRPDLSPYLLPKRTMIGLSHAIEDECLALAERPLVFACFQRESFYRAAEPRWRELARTAELAVAFAAFPERRHPPGGPIELPLDRADPLGREWSLVCEAPGYSACLAGWERPGQEEASDLDRTFETLWTVEPGLVREAVLIALGLASRWEPELRASVDGRLDQAPAETTDQTRSLAALANRMVAYVGGAGAGLLAAPHGSEPA